MLEHSRSGLSRLEAFALSLVLGSNVAVVCAHRYLAMADAPSHIATAVISRGLAAGDPFFSTYYSMRLVPQPYWTTTLLMEALMTFVDAYAAFSVVMLLYVAGLPVAFFVLAKTAAPDNVALTLVVALGAFGYAYWMGESNFLLAHPLVLLACTTFVKLERFPSRTFFGFAATAGALYLSHIYGLVILLAALLSLVPLSLLPRDSFLASARLRPVQWTALALTVILFLVATYYVLFESATGSNRGHAVFVIAPWRLASLAYDNFFSPTLRSRVLVWLLLVLVAAVFVVPRVRALARDPWPTLRASVNPTFLPPALAVLALGTIGPYEIVDDAGLVVDEVSRRFYLAALLFLLLAVRLPRTRCSSSVLVLALLPLAGVKVKDTWLFHRWYDAEMAGVVPRLILPVPERSRGLGLWLESARRLDAGTLFRHAVNHAVIQRHAYSANVFAAPGQQPLRHRLWGGHLDDRRATITDEEWRHLDFVLVRVGSRKVDDASILARADLLTESHGFRLYRVRRTPAGASP